jgi:hypothetical protein
LLQLSGEIEPFLNPIAKEYMEVEFGAWWGLILNQRLRGDNFENTALPALQVHPRELNIEPGGVAAFSVRLLHCPPTLRGYSSSAIEVLMFKREMRDYRTVSEADILPPWCSTVQVCFVLVVLLE